MTSTVGRARLSCAPCRKRKSKCDEGKPCSSCVLRGTSDRCMLPSEIDTSTSQPMADAAAAAAAAAAMQDADAVRAAAAAGLRVLSGGGPAEQAAAAAQVHMRMPKRQPRQKKRARLDNDAPSVSLNNNGSVGAAAAAAASASTPLGEIAILRASVERLEALLQQQSSTEQALSLLHPSLLAPQQVGAQLWSPESLPERDDELLASLVAVLPSRVDCEVLLEYLFQEADWLTPALGSDLALNIWSRVIYGGRVSLAESGTLCALLCIASTLLAQGGTPHRYYAIVADPRELRGPLLQYALDAIHSSDMHHPTWEKVFLLGSVMVYTSISRSRTGDRAAESLAPIENVATATSIAYGLFDESNAVWNTMDPRKVEWARRLAWHALLRERYSRMRDLWTGVLAERPPSFAGDFNVTRPQYDGLGLGRPFVAHPDGLPDTTETALKTDPEGQVRTRLFRHKAPGERERSAQYANLLEEQSVLCLEVSQYLETLASWTTMSESTPHRGSDEQREQLLQDCARQRQRIEQWGIWITRDFPEASTLERPTELAHCRASAQANSLHAGLRHLLWATLRPWLARDVTTEDPSSLLLDTQMHALDLARSTARTVPSTRALRACGLVPFIATWSATNFLDAATTLSVPLVALVGKAAGGSPEGDTAMEHSGAADADADADANVRLRALLALRARPSHSTASLKNSVDLKVLTRLTFPGIRNLAHDVLLLLDTFLLISPPGEQESPRAVGDPNGHGDAGGSLSLVATRKVERLVERYGVRGASETDSTANHTEAQLDTNGTAGQQHDILETLLSLDEAVWDTLMMRDTEDPVTELGLATGGGAPAGHTQQISRSSRKRAAA